MSQPEIVQADLADEDVVARVDLGGEDELYVTPTRTLIYRAEGLLSDEGVEEYPHGAERITVSEGRRKSNVTLEYGLDGGQKITLPSNRLTQALQPIVEGIFRHNGVLKADESVVQLFRFSELTVAVASERVVRHIGSRLWDQEFESYHYSDVANLAFEDGSVNTSVVLTVDGQQERFKTPNEDARAVRSAIESTLLSYWDVDSIEEFRAAATPDDPVDESEDPGSTGEVAFGNGPDPLFADPAEPEEIPDNAARTEDGGPTESDMPPGATGDPSVSKDESPEQTGGTTTDTPRTSPANEGARSGDATDIAPESDAQSTSEAASQATRNPGTRDGPSPPGAGFEGSGFEAATTAIDEELIEEVAGLRETVERQSEELTAQRELLEQLIEELRRGR